MDQKDNQKCIRFVVDDERAVLPTKAHASDIGYDLTVIDVFKKISEKITLFETGIRVSPPKGYYFEIIPRSSMSKTGYILANSVGTIDPDYTGTLKVALIKVDEELEDIKLPFTRCQLVLRKAECAEVIQVESIENTVRGDGGFGSSDIKNIVV
jgi:dUTP pyrophosphatase